jgi:hypothetical protein
VISGIVTELHAIVSVTFLLPNGSSFPIEFVIDTVLQAIYTSQQKWL